MFVVISWIFTLGRKLEGNHVFLMLRRSNFLFARLNMNLEEVQKKSRRIIMKPQSHLGQYRMNVWQQRFKELGPPLSRVWVALGGKMRRRRIGRSVGFKDHRYYWRPIEPQYQRLYQSRLRKRDHSNPVVQTTPLRPSSFELGNRTSGPLFEKCHHVKYGAQLAPPKRLDFEFRVF